MVVDDCILPAACLLCWFNNEKPLKKKRKIARFSDKRVPVNNRIFLIFQKFKCKKGYKN